MSLDFKPWDCQLIKKADTNIVILFYKPRAKKEFIVIPIRDWIDMTMNSKMKSITEAEAKLISSDIISI